MPVEIQCPECDETIRVLVTDRDNGLKCPTCGVQVLAGKPTEKAEPAPKPRKKKKRRVDGEAAGKKPIFPDDEPISNMIAAVIALAIILGVIWGIVAGVRWIIREVNQEPLGAGQPFRVDPLLERPDRPVFLADMREFNVQMGPWQFGKGELGNGNKATLQVRGVPAPRGLAVSPWDRQTTRVSYALGGKAERFSGAVGLNDADVETYDPVVFSVLGDGRELWRSQPITRAGGPEWFSLNVGGVQVLELLATAQGRHNAAHAVWIDPVIDK